MASSELSLNDSILVTILAATDAVFLPDRDPLLRPRHAVIYERRRDFAHSGVPWTSEMVLPGMDDAGRKRVQRALEELALDGQVVTFQPKGAKTLGVRLSDVGEERARALAGLPATGAALALLGQLSDLERTDAAGAFQGHVWLPETALAGVRWGDNERRHALVELEEKLLPGLVRGWIESNCTVHGHCWYRLTDAGRKRIGKTAAASTCPPAKSEEARRDYYQRVRMEFQALAAAKPECEREIGDVPMPVCPTRPNREPTQ